MKEDAVAVAVPVDGNSFEGSTVQIDSADGGASSDGNICDEYCIGGDIGVIGSNGDNYDLSSLSLYSEEASSIEILSYWLDAAPVEVKLILICNDRCQFLFPDFNHVCWEFCQVINW